MSEKGGVRRMNTRSSGNKSKIVSHESKWKKSQDHFECFTNLIRWELDDELGQVEEPVSYTHLTLPTIAIV